MTCNFNSTSGTLTVTYNNNNVLSQLTCYKEENVKKIEVIGQFTELAAGCFSNYQKATEIILSDSIEKVGNNIISGTKIKTLHIPKNLASIASSQPFDWCNTLESFTADEDHENVRVIDGVLFSKDMKILYFYPNGKKGKVYNIPHGTESLFYDCFSQTQHLAHIIIPASVRLINSFLFKSYTVKNVTILRCPCENYQSTLTFAGKVYDTIALCSIIWKNVTYNETLSSNGETLTISPLRLCNVSYFNIDFDDIYFSENKDLKTVIIEEGIGSISVSAFHGCSNLNKIIFPRTIKTIESACFRGCNIRCNSIVYSPESTSLLLQHFTRNVLGFCVNTNICTKGNEMLYIIIALMMS